MNTTTTKLVADSDDRICFYNIPLRRRPCIDSPIVDYLVSDQNPETPFFSKRTGRVLIENVDFVFAEIED